jgi:hypothetical protein
MNLRRTLVFLSLTMSLVGCYSDEDAPVGVHRSGLGSMGLVISAIYGGGGNSGATVKNDYIELFNRGPLSVSTSGLSLQYAGNTATTWTTANSPTVLPSLTVPAGGYVLVGEAAGAGGSADLPTPVDATGNIAMAAGAGKVALVNGTTALTCGATCASDASVLDFVGYGASANDFEGSDGTVTLSNTTAAVRAGGGCTDSDDNHADFTAVTVTVGMIHNSGSSPAPCMTTSDDGGSTGNDDGGSPVVDMAAPDLSVPADLSTPADLTVVPDLTMSSDDGGAPPPAKGPVVISQIYGGGGNSGASYANDFVELFNRGSAAVAIGGWSIQYGSSANAFSRKAEIPAGASIAPGQYFLVSLAAGTSGGTALPAPDYAQDPTSPDVVNLSATSGKVALVANATLLTCGAAANRCSSPWIMDLVGYGSAADFEGMVAMGPSGNVNALFRAGGGCADSDNNKSDFSIMAAAPRNSASPAVDCSSVVVDLGGAALDMTATAGDDLGSDEDLSVPGGAPDLARKPGGDTGGGCSYALGGAQPRSTAVGLTLLFLTSCLVVRRRRSRV